jgi:hypothetical protein
MLHLDVYIGRLGIVLAWMSKSHDIDIVIEYKYFCLDVSIFETQTWYWDQMSNVV